MQWKWQREERASEFQILKAFWREIKCETYSVVEPQRNS
jgi:hypothetical protein